MSCFEDNVFDWAESQNLFVSAKKILLAVSGGADSVVMACVLHRLRQQGRLRCDVVIGHVNHGLRGADSDGDEVFVTELGRLLEMKVIIASVPVGEYAVQKKLSIETAGRILRLKALAEMAQEKKCDAIATAHHADDLAETLIHRLMRGTGFRGLCGIRPLSVVYGATFIRPMLNARRSEIIQYAAENKRTWRQDASNNNINFTRNRIRHQLLPVLQTEADAIVDRLSMLSEKSRSFLLRTEKQVKSLIEKGRLDQTKKQFCIEQNLLQDCPPWVFYEVVRQVLVDMGIGLRHYTQQHFDAMRQLIEQKKVKADFPNGVEVVVEKGRMRFSCRVGGFHLPNPKSIHLEIGQTIQFGSWMISSKVLNREEIDFEQFLKTKDQFVEWFDADKITGSVEIRDRQNGDRFWPIGAKGPKKVGRFLMDAGLDAGIKEQAFVVKDSKKILWLAPLRIAEDARISDDTYKVLQISVC